MKLNAFTTIQRYFHTLRYLRPIQIYGRLKFRLYKPKVSVKAQPLIRHHLQAFKLPILKHAHMLSATKVVFLNQVQDITASNIWHDNKLEKLWLYNLHYFDLLHSQFQHNQIFWHTNLILRWINENPPAQGNGWESYTLSLRIVNWIKWLLINNNHDTAILHSLAVQIRYLYKRLEIHLLANHLLANAKALIFAGLFFAGPEAERWLKKGLRSFDREMQRQMLPDGGHFELSPMYHSIILENLLDCINLYHTYEKPIPVQWRQWCEAMFFWLKCMCHADFDIAFFNDAAFGVAPSLIELRDYQERLEFETKIQSPSRLTFLKDSGFCRIQHENMILITDVAAIGASYQPGHGHADSLSFEMSIKGQRVIVNSGTSTYTENSERLRQRGTKAHNTVIIDDKNSSDVWKSFRVAKRAKVFDIQVYEDNKQITLSASHDGYYRQDKIIHTRTWHTADKKLSITDFIRGKGQHKIQIMFYIHPQIKVMQVDECTLRFYNQYNHYIAQFKTDHHVKMINSTYHPEFNVSIANKLIMVETTQKLPANFNTIIEWN